MDTSDLARRKAVDAVALLFDTSTVRLFQNDASPGPMAVLAEFTIATFHGYANVACPDATVVRDQVTNDWLIVLNVVAIFTATAGSPLPQTVYGVYVVDTAGTGLIMFRRFDTPFTFSNAGDGIVLDVLKLRLPVNSFQ